MINTLISNDIRYIKKDPMYILVFFLPIILGSIYKFLVLNIDILKPYYYIVEGVSILVIPMMVGMVFGFRLLDEKDEGVISVYATSPLGLKGYITYRISQCILISLIELIILALFGIVTSYNYFISILIAILLSVCIFLIIGIMGKNKIQGMTLLKLVGLVLMLPILQEVGKNKWDIAFKIIPTDFILRTSFSNTEFYIGVLYILEIIIGIVVMLNYFYTKCVNDI